MNKSKVIAIPKVNWPTLILGLRAGHVNCIILKVVNNDDSTKHINNLIIQINKWTIENGIKSNESKAQAIIMNCSVLDCSTIPWLTRANETITFKMKVSYFGFVSHDGLKN